MQAVPCTPAPGQSSASADALAAPRAAVNEALNNVSQAVWPISTGDRSPDSGASALSACGCKHPPSWALRHGRWPSGIPAYAIAHDTPVFAPSQPERAQTAPEPKAAVQNCAGAVQPTKQALSPAWQSAPAFASVQPPAWLPAHPEIMLLPAIAAIACALAAAALLGFCVARAFAQLMLRCVCGILRRCGLLRRLEGAARAGEQSAKPASSTHGGQHTETEEVRASDAQTLCSHTAVCSKA